MRLGQCAFAAPGPTARPRLLPSILWFVAITVVLPIDWSASQIFAETFSTSLGPVRLDRRPVARKPDIGIMQSDCRSLLDPRLAGEWYWEAESIHLPGADILIKATSILTIYLDGGFVLHEEGTLGGVSYRGRLVQQGDTLTGSCEDGQKFTTKFALDGSGGLWVAGRLYGRQ